MAADKEIWKKLGRTLGLRDGYLNGIEADNNEVYERCYKMLTGWLDNLQDPSYERMALALKDADLMDIRNSYCIMENIPPTEPQLCPLCKLRVRP